MLSLLWTLACGTDVESLVRQCVDDPRSPACDVLAHRPPGWLLDAEERLSSADFDRLLQHLHPALIRVLDELDQRGGEAGIVTPCRCDTTRLHCADGCDLE